MAQIDINTKFITLLGKPLGQSFAARMQNRGYEAAGLNMKYFYTEVENDHLGDVVNGLRYMNFAGFAVTKPNKVEVLKYLDELDPLCAKMGSSNTVVKKGDKLIGYNTDGIGFYTAITKDGIDTKDCTVFCFGAGGVGRAMCSVLAYYGVKKLYITDYFDAAAQSLVDDINKNFAPGAEFVAFKDFSKVGECNMVMNASGIGMAPHLGETPLPEEYVRKDVYYFDACYNPDKTQFLLNAEKAGAKFLNGLSMSLYQGTEQIRLWTGEDAPEDAMRDELLTILEEKKNGK
ncbi:MAG: shikimate dehydrogenase [Subdoligranulum sp.]|nr:shikimate dehydrogenase [Subdoligranulum sp.]